MRSRKFLEFQKAHFRLSPVWHSREELTRACAGCSSVLVGSDQLWLPSNIDADYYTLTWVPDGVNKIAYATSFGTNFLPDWLVPRARAFLSRIQYLPVREKSAVEMVRSYAGLDARLVCDPTLLFTAEEWMCIQPPEPVVRGATSCATFWATTPQTAGLPAACGKRPAARLWRCCTWTSTSGRTRATRTKPPLTWGRGNC